MISTLCLGRDGSEDVILLKSGGDGRCGPDTKDFSRSACQHVSQFVALWVFKYLASCDDTDKLINKISILYGVYLTCALLLIAAGGKLLLNNLSFTCGGEHQRCRMKRRWYKSSDADSANLSVMHNTVVV